MQIKTTEKFKGKWQPRNLLGAFKNKTELYYWTDFGQKSNWIIEPVIAASDNLIRFGDTFHIKKNTYFKQFLAPHKNGFTTTQKDTFEWIILPVPK